MLKLQTDVYSEVDRVIARRLAYAIDHAGPHISSNPKRLHQAADLLRKWDGRVDTSSPAPSIVDAARGVFWPMLLTPRTGIPAPELAQLYVWGEKPYAEEQIILHAPARWLPTRDFRQMGRPPRRRRRERAFTGSRRSPRISPSGPTARPTQ